MELSFGDRLKYIKFTGNNIWKEKVYPRRSRECLIYNELSDTVPQKDYRISVFRNKLSRGHLKTVDQTCFLETVTMLINYTSSARVGVSAVPILMDRRENI